MKVVLVGTFGLKPKATVSMRAVPLAEALVERGHTAAVVTPPWDNPIDSGKEVRLGKVRVLNVALPPAVPLLWYLVLTWRLLRQTLQLRPDVVHIFKPKAFAGLVASALWLLNHLGITSVRVVVDSDDWEGAGGWNELGGYNWAQRLFFSVQEKWVLRQADAVTVASRALEVMGSHLRRDGKGVFYLPNSIGTKGVAADAKSTRRLREKLSLGESPVLLLYTRFFEFKIDRVLDVLKQVVERFPQARLLVVGRGFFEEEKDLDRLAREQGLSANVVQAGWVNEGDLPHYFSLADVAIYPFDDNLVNRTKCSVKLLDLLDAGVPVVADRVGQNAEYIENGKSGVLVESGNSMAMAEAVLLLLTKPDLAAQMGQEAHRRVHSEYNWGVWAVQAEKAYSYASRRSSIIGPVIAWLSVALWMGVIFFLSSQPSPPQLPEPIVQTVVAKVLHVTEYAILALLLFHAYRVGARLPGGTRHALIFSVIVSVLYAVSDETHQSFVPNRHPSPFDVMIDIFGASLAMGLVWRRFSLNRRLR